MENCLKRDIELVKRQADMMQAEDTIDQFMSIKNTLIFEKDEVKELQKAIKTLQREIYYLERQTDEAVEELDKHINFCRRENGEYYNTCSMAIRNMEKVRDILRGNDE